MSDPVKVELDGAVRWVVLDRPSALNSFDDRMGSAFLEALEGCSEESVRCVVVTGEGKAFSAGEDLKSLSGAYEAGRPPDLGEILRRRYNPAVETIMGLKKPVVAAINGVAAGAGVSLALACDYRIMAEEAKLILAFVSAGLVPDSGATWLLPAYLGVGRAIELAMTGDPISAGKAKEMGLVNRVCPGKEVREVAGEVARTFAGGPTMTYGLIKNLIWTARGPLSGHLAAEAEAQGLAGKTEDHLEGVRAFLEKREARFQGR